MPIIVRILYRGSPRRCSSAVCTMGRIILGEKKNTKREKRTDVSVFTRDLFYVANLAGSITRKIGIPIHLYTHVFVYTLYTHMLQHEWTARLDRTKRIVTINNPHNVAAKELWEMIKFRHPNRGRYTCAPNTCLGGPIKEADSGSGTPSPLNRKKYLF